MTAGDANVSEALRRVAEQRVRYTLSEANGALAAGSLLIGFSALLLVLGAADDAWLPSLVAVLGTLVALLGLTRVVRNHRALAVARKGVVCQARVREIHRRPGGRDGDPNDYSLALELPGTDPAPVIYTQAWISPEQAVEMFGFEPTPMQPVEPDDLHLPVLMLPDSPHVAVLAA